MLNNSFSMIHHYNKINNDYKMTYDENDNPLFKMKFKRLSSKKIWKQN